MRLKLDENLGHAAVALLTAAGHDVATVHSQSMCGAPDVDLIACCRDEARCLVTMDAEFGNPLLFPPDRYRGIVLLRIRPVADRAGVLRAVRTLVEALRDEPPVHSKLDRGLWIVQPGRLRVYQPRIDPFDP